MQQIHNYELQQSNGVITEQLIRPTGLLDPKITFKPKLNQIDDLLSEIKSVKRLSQPAVVSKSSSPAGSRVTEIDQSVIWVLGLVGAGCA